jgi:hypothetical protein
MGEERTTIYVSSANKTRLRHLAADERIAEAIVAAYALDRLFKSLTNEEIAAHLKGLGYGMRRPR